MASMEPYRANSDRRRSLTREGRSDMLCFRARVFGQLISVPLALGALTLQAFAR